MQKVNIKYEEPIKNDYFKTFEAKDGKTYGIRMPNPYSLDAIFIRDIFKDIYKWEYLYPIVYDEKLLNKSFLNKSNLWFIAEDIQSKEGVGIGLFEKPDEFSIYMGKLCIKNKFHGIGVSSVLGGHIINHLMTTPESKSLLRFDCDVRANIISSQKFLEKARAKPYGFIANYNNYTDKRNHDIFSKDPIVEGELGSVVMYAIHLNNLWKMRNHNVNLLDNEDIIYYYTTIRNLNRQMKKDNVTVEKSRKTIHESFSLSKDYYKAIVKIEGSLHENTLKQILDKHDNWNVIEWRIPANHQGISSQQIALDNGFIVSGYDPGSLLLELLEDTILFCLYPRGIDYNQFENINLTPANKLIVEKIISKIKVNKIKKIDQTKKYEVKIECWKT